ncbi:hypothetical protein GCM10027610_058600 [Dactylosporangium cerinum]
MTGRLAAASRDWYLWWQEPPLGATILVRLKLTSNGRWVLDGLLVDGAPTAALLRAIPVGRIEAAANAQAADSSLPRQETVAGQESLAGDPGTQSTDRRRRSARSLPPGVRRIRGRPDTFYQHVAAVYRGLAQQSTHPVADLAASHDIPMTTAHRWIKEARRRGFLPPGRPGTSG